jgi:hypothetical protein
MAASLEKRIKVLEVTGVSVVPPRIRVTFVSQVRGAVSMRLWNGSMVERLEDETEAQFLARAEHMEPANAQS